MGLFSSGSLRIQLAQNTLTIGQPLTGSVVLSVPESTSGCTLKIQLLGRSRMRKSVFEKKKTRPWKTCYEAEVIFFEDATVEGADVTHAFEFVVPEDFALVHLNAPDSTLGNLAEAFLENMVDRIEYDWALHARLVVPGMFNDLKASAQVELIMPEDRVR